jgi:phage terminase large subunit-like protein
MFSSGLVWAPKDRRWAMEVINEAAEFPAGQNDDYVDSLTQALMRMRKGGFIRLPSDEEGDELPYKLRRSTRYY